MLCRVCRRQVGRTRTAARAEPSLPGVGSETCSRRCAIEWEFIQARERQGRPVARLPEFRGRRQKVWRER